MKHESELKHEHGGSLPVVVGIDGSPSALAAARWAAREAARRGAPLHLISAFSWLDTRHIGDPGLGGHYRRTMLTSAHAAVSAAAQTAEQAAPGVEISERVDDFLVPLLIAASRRAGLLVIGDRSLGGCCNDRLNPASSPPVSSVTIDLAARAQCPVVVVHGGESSDADPVVIGIDGSELSEAAPGFAFQAADASEAPLIAVVRPESTS